MTTPLSEAAAPQLEPGPSVQPMGLVAVISPDWRIAGLSRNAETLLGIAPERLLGQQIATVFRPGTVHAIRNRLAMLGEGEGAERLYHQYLIEDGRPFDLLLHAVDGSAIIEALPASDQEGMDVAALVDRMARRCDSHSDLASLADEAARCIRAMTGFDSIALWRSNGDRIASCARAGSAQFTDTPPPACDKLRLIGDAHTHRSELLSDGAGRRIDLDSTLLGADPGDVAGRLSKAGARACLFLPLVVGGAPWGMVSAYHGHERLVGLARLSAVELFVRLLALRIEVLELRG